MSQLCSAALRNDSIAAHAQNLDLMDLHDAMFCQANPIPVKYALARMGKMAPGVRLPLTRLESQYHEKVDAALRRHKLLN